MQFTDRKLCLTDRQKPLRTVRTEQTVRSVNGPLQCGYIGQHSLTVANCFVNYIRDACCFIKVHLTPKFFFRLNESTYCLN